MTRTVARAAAVAALTVGVAAGTSLPAFAGQAYSAPGFASDNASCVGSAMNFAAHYGTEGGSWPDITHGAVGPTMSGHATSDGPGAVGDFQSNLAQTHGWVGTCLP